MKNVILHQLGEKVRARQPFNCPEGGFKRGATFMLIIAAMCFGITSLVTQPDLRESPVIRLDGYINLMTACDFVPGNYFGGLGWMAVLSLFFWSVYAFYARALLTAEEGMCSQAMVNFLYVAGWVFVSLAPFAYLWFEIHPTFDVPETIFYHAQGLVALYLALALWLVAQWVFAKAVLPANKHGFKTWTAAVWIHLLVTVVVCIKMEYTVMHFWSTGEIPAEHADIDKGLRLRSPGSVMQVLDLLRWSLFFYCAYNSSLDGWSPIAPWNEADRGGVTVHGRMYAPYVKVDALKMKDTSEKAAFIAEMYEDNYDHTHANEQGCDEDWGSTIANVNAVFEIDDRINFLHPDLRTGFLKEPAKFEAIARISITTLAWARMAVRVTLPDSVNDASDLLKSFLKTTGMSPGDASSRALLTNEGADETHKVADFLFQEDMKEFHVMHDDHLHQVLQAKHKPKNWGMVRWLWHHYWNGALIGESAAALSNQMIRTSPEGRLPDSGVFGKRYYGALPFRLGPGACKWGLQARQKHLIGPGPPIHQLRTKGKSVSEFHAAKELGADRYKDTAVEFLHDKEAAVFDFVVQVATDDHHDLVQGSAIWPEDTSPYVAVGTLTIPGGQSIKEFEDGVVFSVLNNLKEHKPVGPMNMARHEIYKRHAKVRSGALKHCPVFGIHKRK